MSNPPTTLLGLSLARKRASNDGIFSVELANLALPVRQNRCERNFSFVGLI